MEQKYNLGKLIKVGLISEPSVSTWYTYKKEVKIMGITIIKEGFYNCLSDYEGKEAPKNHFLFDNTVYEKRSVILYFKEDYQKQIYFDTPLEAAMEFYNEITSKGRFI